jgi:hypothetical protein
MNNGRIGAPVSRGRGPAGAKPHPIQHTFLGKYRTIKVVSWRVNFSTDAIADFEGLLAVNREICKQQMLEKAPPDAPPYCAVFP